MNYDRLKKNIEDQIKEAQLKLGFIKETVRLYYPLTSLEAIVEERVEDANVMIARLEDGLSEFAFQVHEGRIAVCVPSEYVEYVHREVETPAFLAMLIENFQKNHHMTLEQVKDIFAQFGEYYCEKMPEDAGFDYVLHFADKTMDEFYYCIKMEMDHTIYHRFTKADYEQF